MMKNVFRIAKNYIFILMALLSTTARAADFEANHTIVSTASDGMGLNTITLEMTITNNSSSDLNTVILSLISDPKVIVIGAPQLEVANLNAGSTTTVNWALSSPLPAEVIAGSKPLMFSGEALDINGSNISVHLISSLLY